MSLLAAAFTALLLFFSQSGLESAMDANISTRASYMLYISLLQSDPEACPTPYTVRYGDSLRKIAKRCGVTVGELIAANPQIANPNHILVGWQINLPGQPAASADPTEEPASGQGSEADAATDVPPVVAAEPVEEIGDTENITSPRPEVSGGRAQADRASAAPEGEQADSQAGAAISVTGSPEESSSQNAAADQSTAASQAAEASQSYQVQWGDSLGKIARRMGVSLSQIMYANPELRNPNVIYPGQVINIPPASLVVPEDAWKEQRIDQALVVNPNYSPSANERWIDVDLATQTAHAYEGETLVRSFIVSTGLPRTPTVTGQFKIWTKLRFDDMRGPGYDLKAVPYVMYFYKGYGLHGTYWHNNFGTPMSHGCVNFSTEDAAWLFDFASVGTVVNVQ